jgi:hypothetical protein
VRERLAAIEKPGGMPSDNFERFENEVGLVAPHQLGAAAEIGLPQRKQ